MTSSPDVIWAVVPVKSFALAKARLSPVLCSGDRQRLALAMADDVLGAIRAARIVERLCVLSDHDSRDASELAARHGACALQDREIADAPGLNAAIAGTAALAGANGAGALLIVHSDLPLLTADALLDLMQTWRGLRGPQRVVLARSRDGGTNLLLAERPQAFAYRFGVGSYALHRDECARRGCTVATVDLPSTSLDIDTPDDFDRLRLAAQAGLCSPHTAALIGEPHPLELLHVKESRGMNESTRIIHAAAAGALPSAAEALILADCDDMPLLLAAATEIRDRGAINVVTYSRKVFLPLTRLCRDVCHYCTFSRQSPSVESAYLTLDQMLETARQGARLGCREALFTLGEKPELRYEAAREALDRLGFATTIDYVAHAAAAVFRETGLLPHINAGCLTYEELAKLRPAAASMGLMLESASERLCGRGMPHHGSPDKHPAPRLATLEAAGRLKVPMTSGILIGIGETRRERIEALLALRDIHWRHGHLQEVIVQNFRAKPGTLMAGAPEPSLDELCWTIAIARIVLGADMGIQAPPNLSPHGLRTIVAAGINDWGGVSPLTADFVNPEAPWPHLDQLERETRATGKHLQERLTIYPRFAIDAARWVDPGLRAAVVRGIDAEGLARTEDWIAGGALPPPEADIARLRPADRRIVSPDVDAILRQAVAGELLGEQDIVRLLQARGEDFAHVCQAADELRAQQCGDTVSFVVNRNINYTNVCTFGCQFCAFSKGGKHSHKDAAYDLDAEEIALRVRQAWERGATEVCMQGGIHPSYTGDTYLRILNTVKAAAPDIHVHAFSPLEIWQGAQTLGLTLVDYLSRLKAAGLGTLPGTAAEILDDEVRATLCPDKINTEQWLEVMRCAHGLGIRTTATIMFGHLERLEHAARHLLRVRSLAAATGGFTEFVPLPFVHMESPLFVKGKARKGPTFREALLMHAVARLVLHPHVRNVQASWVKLGPTGVQAALKAGVNDVGGTLMNESITRSAGAVHGQEMTRHDLSSLVEARGRVPRQRTTLYGTPTPERLAAHEAPPSRRSARIALQPVPHRS